MSVLDRARPPGGPSRPNHRQNILLGLLVGLGSGIILSFLRYFVDNRVRAMDEAERITGLPALAWIPPAHAQAGSGTRPRLLLNRAPVPLAAELAVHSLPRRPISEAFRRLRTSVLLSSVGNPPQVILITSSLRGEGKTTVAMNLATSLAQKGDKVVIVDADMRRPSVHKALRANVRYGLSSILGGSAPSLEDVILATSISNLSLIAAGPIPSHPSELLASERFAELIAELRKRYDFVVIDSPPALALADANVLAHNADGVILISRSGVTTRESLTQTKRLLEGTRANFLGVVVNCTNEQEALYGAYHYYYPYYGEDQTVGRPKVPVERDSKFRVRIKV